MAVVSITTLKSYFETGDKPTEPQYVNLIDTLNRLSDTYVLEVALAQLDTDITLATGVAKFPIPEDMTFSNEYPPFIRVDTAPVGASATWDINVDGATILSTKISIETTELTSKNASSQPVFSTLTANEDDPCTVDCDQKGVSAAGQNPVLVIIYTKGN